MKNNYTKIQNPKCCHKVILKIQNTFNVYNIPIKYIYYETYKSRVLAESTANFLNRKCLSYIRSYIVSSYF